MASKAGILFLAFLGAVLCLQAVWANDVEVVVGGAVTTSHDADPNVNFASAQVPEPVDLIDSEADESVEATTSDALTQDENVDLLLAHPLARILHERWSKKCWSKKNCKAFFKKPGCCKRKCVNLANDNSNCGKCGKCCKKGTCCTNGKCLKKVVVVKSPKCGKKKHCEKGLVCCKGKCVKLRSDKSNCGKCGKTCSYGSSCCDGHCKNVMGSDCRNCGGCGKRCKYGDVCCKGKCICIHGTDRHNCGGCGKYCYTKCIKGTCGYGH